MPEWSRIARRIRVPLGFAFALFYFWVARPNLRSIGLGGILIVPGLLIRALASGHIRKNKELTTSGPYAYTRNPLYLGSLLIGIGFGVAARRWCVGIVLVAIFFAIYFPVILDEEKFLRQEFNGFDEYAGRVPRLIPRLTRGTKENVSVGFSLDLYLQHREYNALTGALAMLAALVVKMLFLPR